MTLWFISDTHFGHANMLTFTGADGKPVREFASVAEMDETMVDRWNAVVRPSDHVYHLGDVALRKPQLQIVKRLAGQKRLIRGNHDIFEHKDYAAVGFQKTFSMRVFNNMLFTHIPIHPRSVGRFARNVHGHIHDSPALGHPYRNVCVEATGYRPLSLEELSSASEE